MHEFALSRRQLLGGGLAAGVVAAAGCLGLGSDTADEAAETELTLSLTRIDGPLRDRYVDERTDPDDRWDEQALDAALSGSHYTTQHRQPFFAGPDDPAYVRQDGTYYELGSVIVDEVTETHPVLRLFEAADGTATPVDGSEDGDLPDADQRAVRIAHMAARARGNEGGFPVGLVQRGGYVYRPEAARAGSDLLVEGGPDHVTYRGTTYTVEITREEFYEPVYRPTATLVAEDPDRMEAILRAAFVGARVSEADLSADAQRIVAEARAQDYSETHPFSEPYAELLRALHERAYLDGNIQKDATVHVGEHDLIRYDDWYYDYSLRLSGDSEA